MTTFAVLLALFLLVGLVAAVLRTVSHDAPYPRWRPAPRSHVRDPFEPSWR